MDETACNDQDMNCRKNILTVSQYLARINEITRGGGGFLFLFFSLIIMLRVFQ